MWLFGGGGSKTELRLGHIDGDELAFKDRFQVMKELGTGAFSVVKLVKHLKTHHEYAAKIIDKSRIKGKVEVLENEIHILRAIKYPNIVKLIELYASPSHLYMIIEYASGGELFDRIIEKGNYTEKDASAVTQQILGALDYIHSQGIVHRDLKPENLLYATTHEDAPIMISDFGLAVSLKPDEKLSVSCGTPGYVAPEVLLKKGYGVLVDCFALGVIAYILLCGFPPFYDEDEDDKKIFALTCQLKYEFESPFWDEISDAAKDFIRKLITMTPEERISAKQAMEHPWIAGGMARTVNIQASVAEQIKRKLIKSKWKRAFNAQKAILRMRHFSSHDLTHGGDQSAPKEEPPCP